MSTILRKKIIETLNLFLNYNGLKQLVKKATRVTMDTATLIDVIMSNTPGNISITEVIPASISDHDMIGCVRKLNHSKYKPKQITCRNYTNYNPKEMCKDLNSEQLWEPLYSMTDVNQAWYFIKSILVSTFNKHAPIIDIRKLKGVFVLG